MASIKALGFNNPQFMAGDGCAAYWIDKATLTANPAVNDTVDFRIPAGAEVCSVEIQCDKLDSNGTPLMAFGAGFAPIAPDSSLAANAAYFAAAGQTMLRTGGRLVCSFKPVKFDEDVMLRLTIGAAAATFAAGDIVAIISGNCRGVR